MATVVIFGSTGYAGGHIASELVARGHDVIGVSRSDADVPKGVQSVRGSIFDPEFVRTVTANAQHIVVAVPAAARGDEGTPLRDALPLLTQAAIGANARLGVVGGAGSLEITPEGALLVDSPAFPEAALPEARAHGTVLEELRRADEALDWFYLSPAATFGSWNAGTRTGAFRLGGDVLITDADGTSAISGADYAIAFADEIEQGTHRRARFCVAY